MYPWRKVIMCKEGNNKFKKMPAHSLFYRNRNKKTCFFIWPYINIPITMFLTTFRRFSKIVPKAWWMSPNIFRTLPKVTKDFRGGTDDVSIIQHHLWVLFKRLCSYSNGNLKTCDKNLIFLHVWVSFCFFCDAHLRCQVSRTLFQYFQRYRLFSIFHFLVANNTTSSLI